MWLRQDHHRPYSGSRNDEMPTPSNAAGRIPSGGSRPRQGSKTMDSGWRPDELLSSRRPDRVAALPGRATKFMGAVCIDMGNVEPAMLQNGTCSSVCAACAATIEKDKRTPLGFVLMPGRSTPPDAKSDSVRAMVEATTESVDYSQVQTRFGCLKKGCLTRARENRARRGPSRSNGGLCDRPAFDVPALPWQERRNMWRHRTMPH
jgi:hypothetical protein